MTASQRFIVYGAGAFGALLTPVLLILSPLRRLREQPAGVGEAEPPGS